MPEESSSSSSAGYQNIIAADTCSCSSCGTATDPIWQSHTTSDPQGCGVFSASPVPMNPANGGYTRTEFDFGTGMIAGLPATSRDFSNLVPTGDSGRLGWNWHCSMFPTLVLRSDGLYMYTGLPRRRLYFAPGTSSSSSEESSSSAEPGGEVLDALFYVKSKLTITETEFIVTGPTGMRVRFAKSGPMPDKVLGFILPNGAAVDYEYDGDRIISLTRVVDECTGAVNGYYYGYEEGSDLIRAITLRIAGTDVRRVNYDYVTEEDEEPGYGLAGDLRFVTYESRDEASGTWGETGRVYYRYYTEETELLHGLKFRLDAEGWRRMIAAGLDPLTATDPQMEPYAELHLEYSDEAEEDIFRISGVVLAGQYEHTFAYAVQAPTWDIFTEEDFNRWTLRTTQTPPDGNLVAFYANEYEQPVYRVQYEAGSPPVAKWVNYVYRNVETGTVALWALPSGVMVIPVNPDDFTLSDLKSASGLIHEYAYSAGRDLIEISVHLGVGDSSAPIPLRAWEYEEEQTVDGVTILFVTASIEYLNGTDTGETTYAYDWHEDTYEPSKIITTPPVIPTTQNGTDTTYPRTDLFDINGNTTWSRDERGVLTAMTYDRANLALTQVIRDVETDILPAPQGWTTPAGDEFGNHAVHDYENDTLGRNVRTLGPWHEVDLDGTPTMIRSASWTVHGDSTHELRQSQGFITGQNATPGEFVINPVNITRTNAAGRVTDQIAAVRGGGAATVTGGRVTAGEPFPQGTWVRWMSSQYDDAGQMASSRVYHAIPVPGPAVTTYTGYSSPYTSAPPTAVTTSAPVAVGVAGANYAQTDYAYDDMGRQYWTMAPGGTISMSTFNSRGLPYQSFVGTVDGGAEDNMRMTAEREYDNGDPGLDGNLTKETVFFGPGVDDKRVTTFVPDWRNRRTEVLAGGTGGPYYDKFTYDNADRVTMTERYNHDDPDVLLAKTTTDFDNQSRVYKSSKFSVSGASVGDSVSELRWYDASGNTLKQRPLTGRSHTRMEYDGVGRMTVQYMGVPAEESSSSSSSSSVPDGGLGDVMDDLVVQQSVPLYDAAGNVTFQSVSERFHDASDTATGPLRGPTDLEPLARVSYSASYPDPLGRTVASANFGTNGGAEPVRPAAIPASSDLVPVSRVVFNARGEAALTVDANGIASTSVLDHAGRLVRTVAADPAAMCGSAASGMIPASQTTEYRYNVDGMRTGQIQFNNGTEQVTEQVYGVSLYGEDEGVARNDLLRAVIDPLGRRTEFSYNRLGQTATVTDANGTMHDYTYDDIGRMEEDTATPGTGVDGTVRSIKLTFTDRGEVATVTSYDEGHANVLNQVAYTYDGFGQVATESQSDEAVDPRIVTYTYTYDEVTPAANSLRLTGIEYPNGRILSFRYDDAAGIDDRMDRVLKIVDVSDEPEVELAAYEWLGTGTPVKVTMPEAGIVRTMVMQAGETMGDAGDQYNGLDRFSRLEDARWIDSEDADIERVEFGHDRLGNVIWRSNLVAPVQETPKYFDERYQYDMLYRLTGMTRGTLNQSRTAIGAIPAWSEGWQLDQAGNWLQYDTVNRQVTPVETLTQPRVFNAGNEITFIGDMNNTVTAYDNNGNMTVMPKVGDWDDETELVAQQLTWDAWNRLVEITEDEGEILIGAYTYDGLGRRITKDVDGQTQRFYYSQSQLIEERVGVSETADRQYVWGADGALVLRDYYDVEPDQRLYAIHDGRSITALVGLDATEWKVLNRLAYRAYGFPEMLTSEFAPTTDTGWEWRWNGMYWDGESGVYVTGTGVANVLLSRAEMRFFRVGGGPIIVNPPGQGNAPHPGFRGPGGPNPAPVQRPPFPSPAEQRVLDRIEEVKKEIERIKERNRLRDEIRRIRPLGIPGGNNLPKDEREAGAGVNLACWEYFVYLWDHLSKKQKCCEITYRQTWDPQKRYAMSQGILATDGLLAGQIISENGTHKAIVCKSILSLDDITLDDVLRGDTTIYDNNVPLAIGGVNGELWVNGLYTVSHPGHFGQVTFIDARNAKLGEIDINCNPTIKRKT